MEKQTLDGKAISSQTYLYLGLDKSSKEASGIPRVISLLSSALERSIQVNEKLLLKESKKKKKKDVVTVFHGLRPPAVSIKQYLERIFKYSGCCPSCFVVAKVYIDRFIESSGAYLTLLNIHRLLITSVMVATKFIDDASSSKNNAHFAKVGGVSTAEMNRLEMNFLFSIDFRLHVPVEVFGAICVQLEKESSGAGGGVNEHQMDTSFKACRIREKWPNSEAKCSPTGLSCSAI